MTARLRKPSRLCWRHRCHGRALLQGYQIDKIYNLAKSTAMTTRHCKPSRLRWCHRCHGQALLQGYVSKRATAALGKKCGSAGAAGARAGTAARVQASTRLTRQPPAELSVKTLTAGSSYKEGHRCRSDGAVRGGTAVEIGTPIGRGEGEPCVGQVHAQPEAA
eukprot:897944-Pelagomonas_calceolata.AAC.2